MFEVKVRYTRQTADGVRTVTELYLTEAVNCSEAEKRIIEYVTPYMQEGTELNVVSVKDSGLAYGDVLYGEATDERYYRAKLLYSVVDETGKENKIRKSLLVQADSLESAVKMLVDEINGTCTCDVRIVSVQETAIVDIILINESDES